MLTLKFRAQRYKKLVIYKTLSIFFVQSVSAEIHFFPEKQDSDFFSR